MPTDQLLSITFDIQPHHKPEDIARLSDAISGVNTFGYTTAHLKTFLTLCRELEIPVTCTFNNVMGVVTREEG